MKESLKSGFSFGITTGIITTLGLIVGLNSGTHSALAVLGGIASIAVSDGLGEAVGMHVAKESERKNSNYVWQSTFATFAAKFVTTMTFAIPVLFVNLQTAVAVDIAWGMLLLVGLSYLVAKEKGEPAAGDIFQHLLFAVAIIVVAHYVGLLLNAYFS